MIKAGKVEFVVDQAALHALLASPQGPVAKELGRLGGRIEGRAKELLSGELVAVDTGRLRSSTSWKLFTRGDTVGVAVGSGVWYSQVIHQGGDFNVSSHSRSNPRRRVGRSRRFRPSTGTHVVSAHTRHVEGRPYLTIAAEQVLGVRIR